MWSSILASPPPWIAWPLPLSVPPRGGVGTTGLSDLQMRTPRPRRRCLCSGFEHEPRGGGAHIARGVRAAARRLGPRVRRDPHRHKVDALSGTALTPAQVAAAERPGSTIVCGRARGRRHPYRSVSRLARWNGRHHEADFTVRRSRSRCRIVESRDQFRSGAPALRHWISPTPGWYSPRRLSGSGIYLGLGGNSGRWRTFGTALEYFERSEWLCVSSSRLWRSPAWV